MCQVHSNCPNYKLLYKYFTLLSIIRRLKEIEQKSVEVEANKRIEELVAKRVEEELERRRDEIEAEVLRRVEEAKKAMEAQMMEELEKRKQEQMEEAQRREVRMADLARQFVAAVHAAPCRTRAYGR